MEVINNNSSSSLPVDSLEDQQTNVQENNEGILPTDESSKKVVSLKEVIYNNRWTIVAFLVGSIGVTLIGLGIGFKPLGNIGSIASISSGGVLVLGTATTAIIVAIRNHKKEFKNETTPPSLIEVTPNPIEEETLVGNVLFPANDGDTEKLSEMLKKNPNLVTQFDIDTGFTAAHYAAKEGHVEILKILKSYNADFEVKDLTGSTPLHWAAGTGRLEAVQFLIEEVKVTIDVLDKNNYTALSSASYFGYNEVVHYLTSKGADSQYLVANGPNSENS